MGRLIIIAVLLAFTFSVYATEDEETAQEQHEAGQWVNDWWTTVREVEINKKLSRVAKMRCRQKLTYYAFKLDNKPDSEYYKRKLEKLLDKCSQQVE